MQQYRRKVPDAGRCQCQLRRDRKARMGSRTNRIGDNGTCVSRILVLERLFESCGNSQLLDHEPRASDQVPLLLAMKEDRLALQKAVDSGDTDLGISFTF